MVGSSRILVDVRGGDGGQLADFLRQLGFIVEEVVPLPDKTREYHSERNRRANERLPPEPVLLPGQSRFFESNHLSLEPVERRPTSEVAAQLFQRLLR
jgi:hypothetical protein